MKNKEKYASKEKEKAKKLKKKKIWMVVSVFSKRIGVIWCNFLGDSQFQTYVLDNVEFVLIFCLHITLWISHTLTSCTHHKQVHVIVC